MNRKPPVKVLKALRREVGFACPMCGSPFLTWHHFDPPWRERKHHNPNGMIALCPEHAAHADGGHFTIEQMRGLKRPLDDSGIVSAKWPWAPEKALFILGTLFLVGEKPVLSLRNKIVFGLRKSALPPVKVPFFNLTADIRDSSGNQLLEIKDNCLTFYGASLKDVRCPPQARLFELKHESGVEVTIRHERVLANGGLQEYIDKAGMSNIPNMFLNQVIDTATDSEGRIPIIDIEGTILTKDVDLYLSKKESSMLCKFSNNERVILSPKFLTEGGKISICIEKEEIISFG